MTSVTPESPAWPDASADGKARAQALQQPAQAGSPTTLIEYRSAGQLLIIGAPAAADAVLARLDDTLTPHVLLPPGRGAELNADANSTAGTLSSLEGHLGAFAATVVVGDKQANLAQLMRGASNQTFDLVLDLTETPHFTQDIPPAGYYAPGDDERRLSDALSELADMTGEFEKPKFFNYDPAICAHGRNGKIACTRCIDACPTLAITSAGEQIAVDPWLCQGGGSCASACPSGAITYAYPPASDTLRYVRNLLNGYHEAGGTDPVILFFDQERGTDIVTPAQADIAEFVLPVCVEEIGAVGVDVWLASLAFGAAQVEVLLAPATPVSVAEELRRQHGYAAAMLKGLGVGAERLQLLECGDPAGLAAANRGSREASLCRSGFETFDEKRNTIFSALERIATAAGADVDVIALPQGAPFGEVQVDAAGCTLCLACASACPGNALLGGEERPTLRFIESSCVQCGLCEITCPEQVITTHARLVVNAESRRTPRVLHEEEPFHCLSCGKAFASKSIIQTMRQKLQGHWMFSDEAAMRRLSLCDECRVKDMFREGSGTRHN